MNVFIMHYRRDLHRNLPAPLLSGVIVSLTELSWWSTLLRGRVVNVLPALFMFDTVPVTDRQTDTVQTLEGQSVTQTDCCP